MLIQQPRSSNDIYMSFALACSLACTSEGRVSLCREEVLQWFRSGRQVRPHTKKSPNSNTVSNGFAQLSSLSMDYRSPSDMAAAVGSTSSLSNPAINHPVALSEDQVSDKEQRDPIDSPSHDNYRLHPTCRIRGPGQSTPSDTATGIVESMRSCSGTRDIRSELGCQSNYNCMVRNMDIFQLLNEG